MPVRPYDRWADLPKATQCLVASRKAGTQDYVVPDGADAMTVREVLARLVAAPDGPERLRDTPGVGG